MGTSQIPTKSIIFNFVSTKHAYYGSNLFQMKHLINLGMLSLIKCPTIEKYRELLWYESSFFIFMFNSGNLGSTQYLVHRAWIWNLYIIIHLFPTLESTQNMEILLNAFVVSFPNILKKLFCYHKIISKSAMMYDIIMQGVLVLAPNKISEY